MKTTKAASLQMALNSAIGEHVHICIAAEGHGLNLSLSGRLFHCLRQPAKGYATGENKRFTLQSNAAFISFCALQVESIDQSLTYITLKP